jgi:hypothetical protein
MREALAVLLVVSLVFPFRAFAAGEGSSEEARPPEPEGVSAPGEDRPPEPEDVSSPGDEETVEPTSPPEGADGEGDESPEPVDPPREVREVMDFDPYEPPAARRARAAAQGRADAEAVGTGEFLAGGIVSGTLFGVVGCAGFSGATLLVSDPHPPREGVFEDPAEELAYRDGFQTAVSNQRFLSAFLGGAIGTAIFFAAVYAVLSATGEDGEL